VDILKFLPDEVWVNRKAELWVIKFISKGNNPIVASPVENSYEYDTDDTLGFTKYGYEISKDFKSEYDLIEHIGKIQDFPEYLL